jgi:hypothetical protein
VRSAYPSFDVSVSAPGRVELIGTEEAAQVFDRCMADTGRQVKTAP